ncbi:MAG: cadmium-translocating P-type ATPase [Acidobacteria bacterium]|nr:cadmium-translocating P-type ATPase [Acidobacteriota bacterium]
MPASTLSFRVHGLDCAEEVSLLRHALDGRQGVLGLAFDVVNARMTIELDPELIDAPAIQKAVAGTGLRAEPWRDQPTAGPAASWLATHSRSVLTIASGLAVLGTMVDHALRSGNSSLAFLSHEDEAHSARAIALCSMAIASGMYYFLPKAWFAIRHRRPDMNVLVSISIAGAIYLGQWSEGATLAFLFSLANLLESWSLAKARGSIGQLLNAGPREASVVHHDHEHRTPLDRVPVGATVRVRPGERIPFDGEVSAGASGVNQAPITGESVPVLKRPGDSVYAGSVNGEGLLDIRTTRAAHDTTLARIVRMVESCQTRRAPSEQFLERFARIYTPVMIALAAAVALVPPLFDGRWPHWFYQSMVILLISCPCALVISTPVTIAAALASAARRGMLIKGGAYLEIASRIRAIAFDKTGVLTAGQPRVEAFEPLNGHKTEDVLRRVASIEQSSEHPLGRAILRYCQEQGIRPAPSAGFQALPGLGAEATIDGEAFWIGSSRMLAARHGVAETAGDSGHTAVFCGGADGPWARIGLTDLPKPEAAEAVHALRGQGIGTLVMLTGDNPATARAVASELGFDQAHAELLPEDKANHIASLRTRHGAVAMVGDGINDAQALAAASLGIAVGTRSTDVALETADVVLVTDDLRRIAALIHHSRRAFAIVKQNVAFALATKLIFLVVAFLDLATLWMAVAADMGATLLVTFNGLRMLRTGSLR